MLPVAGWSPPPEASPPDAALPRMERFAIYNEHKIRRRHCLAEGADGPRGLRRRGDATGRWGIRHTPRRHPPARGGGSQRGGDGHFAARRLLCTTAMAPRPRPFARRRPPAAGLAWLALLSSVGGCTPYRAIPLTRLEIPREVVPQAGERPPRIRYRIEGAEGWRHMEVLRIDAPFLFGRETTGGRPRRRCAR